MAELAVLTKQLDFHLEQVQDFTPTPMTVSTETWYTGYDPYTLEPVFSAKTPREKLAQRQFFFWYKPEERRAIEQELRRIGRADLIQKLYAGVPLLTTDATSATTVAQSLNVARAETRWTLAIAVRGATIVTIRAATRAESRSGNRLNANLSNYYYL